MKKNIGDRIMKRFISTSLFILLNQYNEYKETSYKLFGVRTSTTNETILYLYDDKTKQEIVMFLHKFRDELLEEIKLGIKDRIEHNEFDEAQNLIEHYKNMEEILG